MPELTSYLQWSFLIAIVASLCYTLILLLIKIPQSEQAEKLRWTKGYIAMDYLSCAVVFWFVLHNRDFEQFTFFASMMMLVVTAVSACTLSYSLINLIVENARQKDNYYLNVGLVTILGIVMAQLILRGPSLVCTIVSWSYVALHLIQCTLHIIIFYRVFKKNVNKLIKDYDEEEDRRLSLIRFCYIFMMLTELFVLVYLALPDSVMIVYVLFYALFMLYFTSNFISYLSSLKLPLDSFATDTLSGSREVALDAIKQKKSDGLSDTEMSTLSSAEKARRFKTLERNLEKWVAEKKYREYDKSREEIAKELKTTRELLQAYFSTQVGVDFRTWRTNLRVEDAKRLLLDDKSLSVNYIAEITGFSDRSNFHRQFTKTVGCSPKEWRDNDGKIG